MRDTKGLPAELDGVENVFEQNVPHTAHFILLACFLLPAREAIGPGLVRAWWSHVNGQERRQWGPW